MNKKVWITSALSALLLLQPLSGQSGVQAAAYLDEYGQMNYDGGIENPVNLTVTFFKTTNLLRSSYENDKTGAALGPQTVKAVAYKDGYFKVNSWLGTMWIYPEGPYLFNFKEETQQIQIETPSPVYDYPYMTVLGEVEPQTLTSTGTAAGGWHRVTTSYGKETWIHPRIGKPAHTIAVEEEIEYDGLALDGFQYPNDRSKHYGQAAESSVVKPLQKTARGDWYLIDSRYGRVWVKLPAERIVQSTNETIVLKRETVMFDRIQGQWVGALAPQSVKAVKRLGIWLKINTWRGEAWIIDPGAHER